MRELATLSPLTVLLRLLQMSALTRAYLNGSLCAAPAGRIDTSRFLGLDVDNFGNASQGSTSSPTRPSPQLDMHHVA